MFQVQHLPNQSTIHTPKLRRPD
uniref:Uncharacterized protein n=1 Tax=Anguilla anguilla TaxID=7936 RepID=A0A0E9Q4W1_ANGAN